MHTITSREAVHRSKISIFPYRDHESSLPSYCYKSVCIEIVLESGEYTMEMHQSSVHSLLRDSNSGVKDAGINSDLEESSF